MVQATTASVDFSTERRLTGAYLAIALLALFVGVVTGFLQALSTAGINAYGGLPVIKSYYHGLSLHGVMNVLVWTTFFICGFLPYIFTRALARPLAQQGLAWVTILIMTGGLVLAGVPLVQNNATVMFTFYPPLLAHWMFYVGLTLVVVGTWLVTLNLILTYRGWRRHHADTCIPLPAFMCLITFIMWSIALWASPQKCCAYSSRGPWGGAAAPIPSWRARSSGSLVIPSSISGSCRPIFPGIRWYRGKPGGNCSAIPWRGRRFSSFCYCPSRSVCITSLPTLASLRVGSSCMPFSPSRCFSPVS
jgi:hypothetical protein